MLEGVLNTSYGKPIPDLKRLITLGGAVSVAAAAETILTASSNEEYAYLCYMRADCIIAGTTAGAWDFHTTAGGATILLLQMPVAAAPIGTSYCWPFPVPWKTPSRFNVFTVTPSVATMGTWMFTCNGFYSST
jgi:hypothetical protein